MALAAWLLGHWSETVLGVGYCPSDAAAAPRREPRSRHQSRCSSLFSIPRRPTESRGVAVLTGDQSLRKTISILIFSLAYLHTTYNLHIQGHKNMPMVCLAKTKHLCK